MAPRPTKKSPGSTTPRPPPRPDLPVQARPPPPPGLPATAPRPPAVVGRVAELMGGKGVRATGVYKRLRGEYPACICNPDLTVRIMVKKQTVMILAEPSLT